VAQSKHWPVLACMLPLLALLTGCGSLASTSSPPLDPATYAPLELDGWPRSTPVEQGLDSRLVSDLFRDAAQLPNLYGLVIAKNGHLIAEGYFNGNSVTSRSPRASVAKSYTSALVGIAIEQGLLSGVDQRMVEFFPEFADQYVDPRKRDITIDDMLKMRSGYPWEEQTPPYLSTLFSSSDWLPFLVEFPLTSDPGSQFGYSNLSVHILGIIVSRASGSGLLSFGMEHLFRAMNVQVSWPHDSRGYTYGCGDISVSARDMAKFGQLYLDDGLYQGTQLVPAQWVADSLQSYSTGIYGDEIGTYFREIGYGYLWWSATVGKHRFNYAWGHGGSLIVLLHDLDMVIVATADPLHGVFNETGWKKERAVIDLVGKFIASLPVP